MQEKFKFGTDVSHYLIRPRFVRKWPIMTPFEINSKSGDNFLRVLYHYAYTGVRKEHFISPSRNRCLSFKFNSGLQICRWHLFYCPSSFLLNFKHTAEKEGSTRRCGWKFNAWFSKTSNTQIQLDFINSFKIISLWEIFVVILYFGNFSHYQ